MLIPTFNSQCDLYRTTLPCSKHQTTLFNDHDSHTFQPRRYISQIFTAIPAAILLSHRSRSLSTNRQTTDSLAYSHRCASAAPMIPPSTHPLTKRATPFSYAIPSVSRIMIVARTSISQACICTSSHKLRELSPSSKSITFCN